MAARVTQVQLKGKKQYKSLEAVVHDACLLLGVESLPNWAKSVETTPQCLPSKTPGDSIRELLRDGSVKEPAQILKEAGFEVGNFRRKADRTEIKSWPSRRGLYTLNP